MPIRKRNDVRGRSQRIAYRYWWDTMPKRGEDWVLSTEFNDSSKVPLGALLHTKLLNDLAERSEIFVREQQHGWHPTITES